MRVNSRFVTIVVFKLSQDGNVEQFVKKYVEMGLLWGKKLVMMHSEMTEDVVKIVEELLKTMYVGEGQLLLLLCVLKHVLHC